MIVLGVDAGGTSTKAVACSSEGGVLTVIGTGRSGPGNPNAAGADEARAAVVSACAQAAGDRADQVDAIALTMAGGSAAGGRLAGLDEALFAAGLTSSRGRPTRLEVHPDTLGAWFSGTADDTGVVLIAGTGAIASTVVDGHLDHVVDGAGWLLGDDGAGFWIGRRAVHDVLAAIDGRGEPTALTDLLLARIPPGTPTRRPLPATHDGWRSSATATARTRSGWPPSLPWSCSRRTIPWLPASSTMPPNG